MLPYRALGSSLSSSVCFGFQFCDCASFSSFGSFVSGSGRLVKKTFSFRLVDLLVNRYCIDFLKVSHFPGFLDSLLALLEGDDQELSEA